MRTIYEQFKITAEKFKRRPVVQWKKKKRWHALSYFKFLKRVDRLSEGFRKLGVEKGDKVALMSENCPNWLATDLALNRLGAVCVPIHTTSNKPLIEYILEDSGSGFLVVSAACLKKNFDVLKPRAGRIKTVVIYDSIGLREEFGPEFIDFEDLLRNDGGGEIERGELSSIVYTSGTTGEPKGVMLTNENFLFDAEASLENIKVYPQDVFLSFLPLSHVLERTAGSYVPILSGASIAYVPRLKDLARSLKEVKPTIFIAVPKIFETSYEKVIGEINKKNALIKKFFFRSLNTKKRWVKFFSERLIYKKIRKNFGGRLRFAISGGAAINEKILKFFRKVGLVIVEGYGLTETSPVVAMNTLEETRFGTVGRPLRGVEIKINADKEIWVKGKNVMPGYWNKPEKTAESLTEDGWFMTGDLGFVDKEKFLSIIGRKKEIIVTSNGKNISPEKVEAIINLNPFISQCLVVGHKKPYLTCLIVPDKQKIVECHGEDCNVHAAVFKEFDTLNNHLMSHERIKKIALIEKPFSIEEGDLTPTLKVRRSIIEHKYRREIERMY